jgi:molybdopterin adenylyltransferase
MGFMAVSEHHSFAPPAPSIRVAVISVSDTRTIETDDGGALLEARTIDAGFAFAGRTLVHDEPDLVRARVQALVAGGGVDVILLTGGTGFAPRDSTVDAVEPLFDRRLTGFGELFRMLSFAEIGSAAMLSRATAGMVGGVAMFLTPGSPAAVRLALDRLILPELAHLVGELRRSPTGPDAGGGAPGASSPRDTPAHEGHGHRHRH